MPDGAVARALPLTTRHASNHERKYPTALSPVEPPSESPPRRSMAIPGIYTDHAPPPLPPQRYNEDLANGIDIAWHWGNPDHVGRRNKLAPIKAGSSLLGGRVRSAGAEVLEQHGDEMDVDGDVDADVDADADWDRRGSTVSAIRSASQAEFSAPAIMTHPIRKTPSPTSLNSRLQGERPLAQENLNRSSHAYDQRLLSKIGKNNSPPHGARSGSTDGAVLARRSSLHTQDPTQLRLSATDSPAGSLDPLSRWFTSPASAGLSPGSQPGWREGNLDHRSPVADDATPSLVLDPELFHPVQAPGSTTVAEESLAPPIRSGRGYYDHANLPEAEADDPSEGTGGLRHLNLEENHPKLEKRASKQGLKRRARSPPSDIAHTDSAAPADPYRKTDTTLPPRSPAAIYDPKEESVSSASSSVRQHSYASSVALSAAASSMTSLSSYDRPSPSDLQASPYVSSTQVLPSPATSLAASRKPQPRPEVKSDSPKGSRQPAGHGSRPGSAQRIGTHYMCECCPKKPKKFGSERDLRAHEMEKQYSCQYCNNRFKNKNEAERHQNSLHLRRYSWSCAAIPSMHAAFHPSSSPHFQTSVGSMSDACGYCGEEFSNQPQPDWDQRIDHLANIHKFGECNSTKKFFRADHFRQHLKHSHAGQSGKWTNMLENACLRGELPVDTMGVSPSESEYGSLGRGPSSLPAACDAPMGGATIDEAQEES